MLKHFKDRTEMSFSETPGEKLQKNKNVLSNKNQGTKVCMYPNLLLN